MSAKFNKINTIIAILATSVSMAAVMSAPKANAALAPQANTPPALNTGKMIGMNATFGLQEFTDTYKKDGWFLNNNVTLPVDANDNVITTDPSKHTIAFINLTNSGIENPLQNGVYHLPASGIFIYDGTGIIQTGYGTVTKLAPGKYQWNLRPNIYPSAAQFTMVQDNPADPIRNFRAFAPGIQSPTWEPDSTKPLGFTGNLFRDAYVNHLKPFGTLRFMDAMATNSIAVQHWGDRKLMSDTFITGVSSTGVNAGLPYELLIDICNRTHTNPWFNMPARADDDYIKHFAQLVHDNLDPSLTPYVEYSNEMWNWGFAQAQWQINQHGPLDKGFYGENDWYSYRAEQIFRIWEGVYGDNSTKFKRVIASQSGWPDRSGFLLKYAVAYANGHRAADVLAIAPYFNGTRQPMMDANKNVTESIASYEANMLTMIDTVIKPQIIQNAAYAKKYGVDLVAYEGGQSLVGQGAPASVTNFYEAVNRDVGMYNLYKHYLDVWFQNGGKQFNFYNDTGFALQYGSWGQRQWDGYSDASGTWHENADDDKTVSPKFASILDYIKISEGHPVPPTAPVTPPVTPPTTTAGQLAALNKEIQTDQGLIASIQADEKIAQTSKDPAAANQIETLYQTIVTTLQQTVLKDQKAEQALQQ